MIDITEDELRLMDKRGALAARRKLQPIAHWRRIAGFLISRLRRPDLPDGWRAFLLGCVNRLSYDLLGFRTLGPDYVEALADVMVVQIGELSREGDRENVLLYNAARIYGYVTTQRRLSEVLYLLDDRFDDTNRFVAADAFSTPFWVKPPEDDRSVNAVRDRAAAIAAEADDAWIDAKGPTRQASRSNLKIYATILAVMTCSPRVPELLAGLGRSRMARFDAARVGDHVYHAVRGQRKDLEGVYAQLNEIAARHGWPDAHAKRERDRKLGHFGKRAAEEEA
jgi:hypothetical protein